MLLIPIDSSIESDQTPSIGRDRSWKGVERNLDSSGGSTESQFALDGGTKRIGLDDLV